MKTFLFSLCIGIFVLLLSSHSVAQERINFDNLFSKWEETQTLQPGLGVAVIKDQAVVYTKTFGYANLEYQIPLDETSVFDIASLAKQFTGFAIAKLILEKKLGLEEPVIQHLPELSYLDKGMRIKHLVYHTSGLRDVGELFSLAYAGENFTSKEALEILKNQRALNFEVGTEYDYSNSNYVLLALIVERVSGMSFRDWCDTYLFSPLKMEDSFVNDNPYEVIKNRAIAYNAEAPTFSFHQNNGMALIGSSAVFSTMKDMIIWVQALQNETVFPEVFSLMKQKGKLDNGEEIDYGFGLSMGSFQGEKMIEHTGATPSGFRTALAIFPNQSLALVVLSNWGDINPIAEFGINIMQHYLPKDEPREEKAPEPHLVEKKVLLSEELMRRYEGNYLFNGEMDVKIQLEPEGNLSVQLGGQAKNSLVPISETEFDLPAMHSKLSFVLDANKTCHRAEVWMNGNKEGELSRVKHEPRQAIDKSPYVGMYYSEELKIVFELSLSNDQLMITNTKMGEVYLESKTDKVFVPVAGVASSLSFEMDEAGEVLGFLLNRGSRLRNLKFEKIDLKQ